MDTTKIAEESTTIAAAFLATAAMTVAAAQLGMLGFGRRTGRPERRCPRSSRGRTSRSVR